MSAYFILKKEKVTIVYSKNLLCILHFTYILYDVEIYAITAVYILNKMLSYRRDSALQAG